MAQNYIPKNTPAPQNIHSALAGTYTTTGSNYYTNTASGFVLKLCTRKVATALKPAHYAMHKTTTGKEVYLTSFYPQPNGTHTAECGGKYYAVTLTADTITFHPLN